MAVNKKADKYKKRAAKEAALNPETEAAPQADAAQLMMGQMFAESLKLMKAVNSRVIQLENEIVNLKTRLKAVDFRSIAMLSAAEEVGALPKDLVLSKVIDFHVDEFNKGSDKQDEDLALLNADDQTAEGGMFMILTADMTDELGNTVAEERIVRAKTLIGDEQEVLPGINAAILGASVGSKTPLTVEKDGKTFNVTITLLGLRRAPPAPANAETV